jgi:hypothetical protein
MQPRPVIAGMAALLLAAGCVQQPLGPRIQVMPSPYKPFDVFQQDQALCMSYAHQQTAGQAVRANEQSLGIAALGTVLGAGLGAAIGGGRGAAVGAAAGALGGTVVGTGPASNAQYSLKQRYDIAYAQCMYAKGNQVPGFARALAPPPPPPPPPPPAD